MIDQPVPLRASGIVRPHGVRALFRGFVPPVLLLLVLGIVTMHVGVFSIGSAPHHRSLEATSEVVTAPRDLAAEASDTAAADHGPGNHYAHGCVFILSAVQFGIDSRLLTDCAVGVGERYPPDPWLGRAHGGRAPPWAIRTHSEPSVLRI
ncbi:hypothetical protein [Nocardia sp. CNY236]|uniref:hypothetical protein n=1 Tax=Nocardia sp. CNY236 TaxID=1169152 RepID=UPI0012DE2DAF|nr:hypothetical protein [Nocardia sp. CNY236]